MGLGLELELEVETMTKTSSQLPTAAPQNIFSGTWYVHPYLLAKCNAVYVNKNCSVHFLVYLYMGTQV